MREIHVIDARTGTIAEKLRVAAYCRVSSDSDDQLNSFLAQVRHYTAYIGQSPEWELADIYADEGLTGTRMDKRDEFNRLMADCQKGQIDLVLVKSTSRFARNTMEFLEALRELRQLGVTVWFENENMRTDKLANETMLALSGVKAQQESISISQNQRWSCQKRMQNGTFIASSAPYGYRLVDGELVIVEEEATIVRQIFDWYLSGLGRMAIADRLNQMQAPKQNGVGKWYINTVSYILSNERYAGNALFQKEYTTETLPFQKKRNCGEVARYYVETTNSPILTPGIYEAAQQLAVLKKREPALETANPFHQKIHCSYCGRLYKRRLIQGKTYWECHGHSEDRTACPAQLLLEADVRVAFVRLADKLRVYRADVLGSTIELLEELYMKADGRQAKIGGINRQVAELREQEKLLTQLKSKGYIESEDYIAQTGELERKTTELMVQRRRLLGEDDDSTAIAEIREVSDVLAGLSGPVTEFDEQLFNDTVSEIRMENPVTCRFVLRGGLVLTELIPVRKRGIAV